MLPFRYSPWKIEHHSRKTSTFSYWSPSQTKKMIDRDTIKLLRIPFSLLLMPVFILALSQIRSNFSWTDVLYPFLILHFLIYPASNGYNSYVDKDQDSIGGLEKPPMPTIRLFYVTLIMDIVAILLSVWLVNVGFALCLLICIAASRAYSARQIRLKKYPFTGFLVVAFFQGGFTYYLSHVGITKEFLELNASNIWVMAACSFQIAGVYPLTQIYQHKQDLDDGVVTISYKLGYRGTFVFSAIMFGICNFCYFTYFSNINQITSFYIIQAFFLPIAVFFGYWFSQVIKDTRNADFKNTMRMNILAAVSMNICFIVLWLKN
jgi:1,4-dihydroxy-2-naphthoate octaprenyltransferase